jgi:hypothetical protein
MYTSGASWDDRQGTGEGGGRVSLRDTFCAGIKVELL